MLDALADRQDARVAGDHMVVHLDPAPDLQARRTGERDRRTDADRHHDQVRGNLAPVLQADRLHLAVAQDRGGVRTAQHGLAACFQRLLQQPARRLVQLPLH